MTKKKKIAKQKPISIGEFKTWIDGYCAASGPEWVPTQEQWQLIHAKIEAIMEQPVVNTQAQVARYAPPQIAYAPYSEPYTEDQHVVETQNNNGPSLSFPKQHILTPQTVINSGNGISADTVGSPSPFS